MICYKLWVLQSGGGLIVDCESVLQAARQIFLRSQTKVAELEQGVRF